MGGGSSTYHKNYKSSDILKKMQASETEAAKLTYESWVNGFLEQCLGNFNNRDTTAINKRIDSIRKTLANDIEGVISMRFGGSLAKQTHINGLSDIDTLVLINNTELVNDNPAEVLNYFHKILSEKYQNTGIGIHKGDMAVTMTFDDGEIQLLPALRYKYGIKIADGKEWSKIVKPSIFARKLTVLNQSLFGKLVPAIKLVKAIVSNFPENAKLNGYHIEALAAEIFAFDRKDVAQRPTSVKVRDLLFRFFKEAPSKVRKPIKDPTGQTVHIDEYLGPQNNVRRLLVADSLERISRKLGLADGAFLQSTWSELLNIK